MAKIDWIERRLQNWVRWRVAGGGGPLGYAQVKLGDAAAVVCDRRGYDDAPIPTNAIEAGETDDAVQRLPSELRATVLEVYLGTGGEAQHMARLCCARATMYARVDRAHRLLAEHFDAREQRAAAERKRVEALQSASRPVGA